MPPAARARAVTEGQGDLVVLSRVTQVEAPHDAHPIEGMALLRERGQALLLERAEAVLDDLQIPAVDGRAIRLDRVVAKRRDETAERVERAGMRGPTLGSSRLPRERASVKRSRTP